MNILWKSTQKNMPGEWDPIPSYSMLEYTQAQVKWPPQTAQSPDRCEEALLDQHLYLPCQRHLHSFHPVSANQLIKISATEMLKTRRREEEWDVKGKLAFLVFRLPSCITVWDRLFGSSCNVTSFSHNWRIGTWKWNKCRQKAKVKSACLEYINKPERKLHVPVNCQNGFCNHHW